MWLCVPSPRLLPGSPKDGCTVTLALEALLGSCLSRSFTYQTPAEHQRDPSKLLGSPTQVQPMNRTEASWCLAMPQPPPLPVWRWYLSGYDSNGWQDIVAPLSLSSFFCWTRSEVPGRGKASFSALLMECRLLAWEPSCSESSSRSQA